MSGQNKNQKNGEQLNAVRRAAHRKKIGEIAEYKISAVDIAIFAAAFAVLYDKSTGASDAVFRKILKNNKLAKIELDDILTQVNSASAEAMAFSGLLSNLRKDLIKETDTSYAESYLIREGSKVATESLEYADESEIQLSDILGTDNSEIQINSTVNTVDEKIQSYTDEMVKMQKASDEFTEVMRELFAAELETLIAENKVRSGETETSETPEVVEIAEAEAGWNPSALLGLIGLGGGGGGGGGLLSALGSGAAGRLFGGFGIDGYVSGATVFWDVDGDFIQDADETIQTITDSTGYYQLSGITEGVGQIVIKADGVDTNTGGSVGMMAASTNITDFENAHVTPLTLLKAQGVSDDTINAALGVTVDIDSYNPMAVLEGSTDATELDTAGTVLLKAQQLFSVVNSVSGLAEEAGLTSAEALAQTVSAIKTQNLDDLMGTDGGDATVLENLITTVAPDFASVAATAAASLKNVNSVLGESLASPRNALGDDARAAALITQDDLVTSFREIGRLDPSIAATEISSKLNSFSNVNDIKTNFRDIYKATIQAQADAEGGIIAGLDSFTVKSGAGQLIAVSEILDNDVNNGTGDLKLVAVEPAGLVYSATVATTSQQSAPGENPGSPPIIQTIYQLDLPSTLAFDDYVKVKLGPFTLIERVSSSDTPEQIATRFANKFNQTQNQDNPFLTVSSEGASLKIVRNDGETLKARLEIANDNSAIDAKIITGTDGEQYVSVDSTTAVSTNLRYIVANDAGQGHGNIRLTIEPDFRTIIQNPGRSVSVNEDSLFALSDQIVFSGTASAGVSEKLFVKLNSVDGTTGDFKLKIDGNVQNIAINTPQQIPLNLLSEAYIVQPANFHGNFDISFDLMGSFQSFSSRSTSNTQKITVNPVAEEAASQAVAKLILGEVESDFNGSIIPVVNGTPSTSQIVKVKLEGGDPQETHSLILNGIPEGLTVSINGVEKTASFGVISIEEVAVGAELTVDFHASEALVDSSFGLYDQVSAVVVGKDGEQSASGSEINFSFDIGGAYGLNVASQALTIGQEDVAAVLSDLDITSIESGASVKVKITLDDPTPGVTDGLPQIGRIISGTFVPLVAGQDITITENATNIVYELSSDSPLTLLDDLKVLHPTSHFRGSINLNAEVIALVGGIETASVLKGPMAITFSPVADAVTYNQPSSSLSANEDNSIDIKPLFFNGSTSLANSSDASEEIIYVVQEIPTGLRLVDGESLKDANGVLKTGDALKAAILTATSIGRVVGDNIELTSVEASRAHIVGLSDASLTDSIKVSAYSKELENSQTSSFAGDYSVSIAINPVADAPYLSADSKVRGLVNDNLSTELASKAIIKIPASAALVDTDGSEALFIKITPQSGVITDFQLTGATYQLSLNNDYILIKASDLSNLEIKRSPLKGSYDDKFTIEAIAVETNSADLSVVDTIISAADQLSATSSIEIDVEFLQPATSPTLTLSSLAYAGSGTSSYDATFTLDIDKQATDSVTILVTGAPNVTGYQTKFFNVDTNQYIGAAAEVPGVWVFGYDDFVDSSGNPYDIKLLLPPGYDGQANMDLPVFPWTHLD